MKASQRRELERTALEVRKDIVRMTGVSRAGHLDSSLSVVDILVYLYWKVLKIRPDEPLWPERDRLVFSKDNASPALYAVLARRGFFEREELWNYRRLGAMLQGRPEHARTPGVDAPGGSRGMAIGIAKGLLLSSRMDGNDRRVFCVIGSEELQEGSLWESVLRASILGFEGLTVVVDSSAPPSAPALTPGKGASERKRFETLGWRVMEADGHNFDHLERALSRAHSDPGGIPRVILARTIPGKGVSSAEKGSLEKPGRLLDRNGMEQALRELELASGEMEEGVKP
ncbi:MAG: 1-deoxy-D-xylulose-5-phosphate synthase N-terminal domain-containing protein [Thermovirgaceae bacterium]|nr:1-deoxy-D-xylulose-5-phosphate synthase N-terminal domain-containing protein [Synergistales bacterium]HRS48116.1 1-deoxy-D-xylulose-5-phosphate synthase N-terminal domain-containing protein [Thermovirgaceae bacterium]HRU91226.1 1-deoxy-D-xylulose-5-phosphate synthase N-terminal domain-containing protein [Thermovirgaceae bacterium]